MNDDMLAKARQNSSKSSITNVDFLFSRITDINLPSASTDVVISNCVINLVPHASKPAVFKEMHRLLKPGGRVAVSDILVKKPLTAQMQSDMALYVGCVAGASKKEEYELWLREAGFEDVLVVDAEADLNVYTQTSEDGEVVGSICCGPVKEEKEEKSGGGCCGPKKEVDGGVTQDVKTNFKDVDLNEWAGKCSYFSLFGRYTNSYVKGLIRFSPLKLLSNLSGSREY
jgi:arsenite methyltransferase